MKRTLFLLLFAMSLVADNYPALYTQLGTPLYEARAQLQILSAHNTLRGPILQYAVLSDQTLEFGRMADNSHDEEKKRAYLKKLRSLQKAYDKLAVFLQKQLAHNIDIDNYKLFLSIVNTGTELFYQNPNLKERIYNYYSAHRAEEASVSLDRRIEKEKNTIVLYNTASARNSYADTPEARYREVTVLATPTCPYCKKAKNFLRENGIAFTEYNINRSATGKRLYNEHHGKGVPVVIINNTVIHGYNELKMRRALQQ